MAMNTSKTLEFSKLAAAACVAAATFAACASGEPQRDWSEMFLASSPSLAPDGSFFAFEWNGRIWRASPDGGVAQPLTDGPSDFKPFISPDGRHMLFSSYREGGEHLFEMTLGKDGLAESVRQVTFHSEGTTPHGYFPDGKSAVAVVRRDFSAPVAGGVLRRGYRAVSVPVAERGAERLLFNAPARDPAISPDGSNVLFVAHGYGDSPEYRKFPASSSTSASGDVWLYDIAHKSFRSLEASPRDERCPVWAPDGKGYYFLSDEGGVRNVRYRPLAKGASVRQVTSFTDDHVFRPTVSRNGRIMVFRKGLDLWRIDPTEKSPVAKRIPLRPAGGMANIPRTRRRWYDKAWNNDGIGSVSFTDKGSTIAFTAGGDVFVMNTSSRNPVTVHGSSRSHERDASFSPDGSTLYFLSDFGDHVDVRSARRDSRLSGWASNSHFKLKTIVSDGKRREKLSVSPDGRLLAWCDPTGHLTFYDISSGEEYTSPVKAAQCEGYVWAPDGRYVAATLRDGCGQFDVWIVATYSKKPDGGPAPEPYNLSRGWMYDGEPAWSPDGRIIAFCGHRTASGERRMVMYVYVNPDDEIDERNGRKPSGESYKIVFKGLADRVRLTKATGHDPFFSPDSRTLAINTHTETSIIRIPSSLEPKKALSKVGKPKAWIMTQGGDKFLRVVDGLPACGDTTFSFKAFQTTNLADYRELAFLTAWATVRDNFCDPSIRGVDWNAVKEKYLPVARNAPSWNVFRVVLDLMYGEVDASHIGFSFNSISRKTWGAYTSKHEWSSKTACAGARFDPDWTGNGWRVADVIPGSHVDCGENGLVAGDVVLEVDGKPLKPGMDYAEAFGAPANHKFRLLVKPATGIRRKLLLIDALDFDKAREFLREAEVKSIRRRVHKEGNFGYIAVDSMDSFCAGAFADAVLSECYGRDGVIVDVRDNGGGSTADRLLDILICRQHTRTLFRGGVPEGYILQYWDRPAAPSIPLVVLMNERTGSNAEAFAHAIRQAGRGVLVGLATPGGVIATTEHPLLDCGTMNVSNAGMFLMDGTDMDRHGAQPDVKVDITPEDYANGRDPQLDAAIKELKKLAEKKAKGKKLPPLSYKQ